LSTATGWATFQADEHRLRRAVVSTCCERPLTCKNVAVPQLEAFNLGTPWACVPLGTPLRRLAVALADRSGLTGRLSAATAPAGLRPDARPGLTVRTLRASTKLHDRWGSNPRPDAFVFSYSLTGELPMHPSSVTHRYARLAARLGINTTLHKLRHYNATELIAAGADPRTIAGRLGHGGGGTTTLRVYAAWVSEADQRAAAALGSRLQRPRPSRPS
jgi:hypothetical protein